MSEQYNLSKKSIKGLARNNREQRGRLAPISKMERRVYDVFQPVRMVVIDRGTLGGATENAALTPVGNRYTRAFFKAVILDDDSTPDVSDMQDPEKNTIVTVSGRFISSVLFTGQEFIGGNQVSSTPRAPYIQCDVIQSPANVDFEGVYRTGKDWNCEVSFNSSCGNANAKTQGVCPVIAANRTGQTLVDGQSVAVRLVGSLFVIYEFYCPDYRAGNNGGDPNTDNNPRTGGGFPLP